MAHVTETGTVLRIRPDPGDTESLTADAYRSPEHSAKFWRRVAIALILLIIAVCGAWLVGSAQAQSPPMGMRACAKHAYLVAKLAQQYAEKPLALGVGSDGRIVEVFVSDDAKTWTILVTRPDGLSCIISAGTHWQTQVVGDDT